ncbi:hypothetical protein Gbth_015_079 [Gluconobacter thailandicus F149-1 = NBRC 100600]|nr:hypothetical protein Gbfr_006_050 [Gluconobacter frateurii M-2]GAN92742.1 hypothetical protein Gbth_015_079 [Gluconobacter thailandicus F149-1 = NBRC 100600]GBR57400.1 hypothetical protein AA100600_0232 [Gluconobacter thailandicus F149-1 = NBRC 100600]GEL86651.1 hypothetical protein GTH01_10090 [Gluconobacter thailandicus F149-1 = NBRC 100600]
MGFKSPGPEKAQGGKKNIPCHACGKRWSSRHDGLWLGRIVLRPDMVKWHSHRQYCQT